MLKRVALMFAATALIATAPSVASASNTAKGALPEQACLAVYPAAVQPALCGEGNGGPGRAG